jgi:hypothetical protein
MARKLQFYDHHGVEEYYIYDPDHNIFNGFLRQGEELTAIAPIDDWVSPHLGIRFVTAPEVLEIYMPNGTPFRSTLEFAQRAEQEELRANLEQERANQEKARANLERERANQEKARAEQEELRAEKLAAQLRALGIEPEG